MTGHNTPTTRGSGKQPPRIPPGRGTGEGGDDDPSFYDDGDELEAITHRRDRRSGKFKRKRPDDPPSGLLFDSLN